MTSLQIKPGSIFSSRYRVERSLKVNNQSARYEVTDTQDGTICCLKVFPSEMIRDATLRQRFVDHVKASAIVGSEYVVQVRDAGVEPGSGLLWFVTAMLSARNLEDTLKQSGAIPKEEAAALLTQIVDALAAVHSAGHVHGNLKPKNILLLDRDAGTPLKVRLADFGISTALAEAKPANGAVQGTPMWMAPEQATAGEVPRPTADVWAFGLLAFRLLTGQGYWRESNKRPPSSIAIMREVTVDPLVPASARAAENGSSSSLPSGFDAWFAACVNRDVDARYGTAGEAGRALADVFADRTPSPPKARSVPAANESSNVPSEVRQIPSGPQDNKLGSRRSDPGPQPLPVQPPKPSRRFLLWLLPCLFLPILSLASYQGWRRYQSREQLRICDTPTVSREDLLLRYSACQDRCAAGSAKHCLQVGRLVLQHKIANEQSADQAARAFEQACQQREFAACRHLAMMYWEGNQDLKKDRQRSVSLLLQACDGDDDAACTQLTEVDVGTISNPQEQERILAALERACQKNEVASCAQLGRLQLARNAPARAFDLFLRACKYGDAVACAQAGQLAVKGDGIAQDVTQALTLFQRACDKEVSVGCYFLAQLYARGTGTSKNMVRAAELFQRDCTHGGAESCHSLALLYLNGSGVGQDRKQGLALLKKACDLGHKPSCDEGELPTPTPERSAAKERSALEAQLQQLFNACQAGRGDSCYRLATLFERGPSTPKDRQRARLLYQLACRHGVAEGCQDWNRMEDKAELSELGPNAFCAPEDDCMLERDSGSRIRTRACGNVKSCLNLGKMHYEGQLMRKDFAQAAEAFQKSCNMGNGEACGLLGQMYEKGEGVGRDPRRAAELYRKACSVGNALGCNRSKTSGGGSPPLEILEL